ncbi:MAG: acyltransferase [Betaproteobacteria bacterium]|nr:acyltransferase [Betaproteobacteria bacterium]
MTIATASRKIDNIQALRGVAVLLVAMTHIMAFERKYIQGERLFADWMAIGTSGVDLFFVISGFIMVHVTRGTFQRPAAVGEFVFHRLRRIYPLYWIYTAMVLVVFFLRPQWVNESSGHVVNVLASFLLLPQNVSPLLQPGWSLVFEMYFYTLFAGLLFLPERRAPAVVALWAVVAPATCFLFGPFQSPLLKLVTSPYCIEFALGCLVAFLVGRGKVYVGALPVLSIAAVLLGFGASVSFFNGGPAISWRVVVYGIPYALLVYAFVASELSGRFRSPRWLIQVGDWSYSLYLSHFLIIAGAVRLWALFDFKGILDNAVVIALTITAVLVWARISYVFLERPILRGSATLWDRLFAGKAVAGVSR